MIRLMHAAKPQSRAWLESALSAAERYHRYYTSGGHHLPDVGLERFWDFGPHGSPPPEADSHERDEEGRTPHERIRQYFREQLDRGGIDDYSASLSVRRADGADIRRFYDYAHDELTPEYYDQDRAMRESGFDYSRRFGPFNASILDYAPVCLNSLLYQLERDIAALRTLLGSDSAAWTEKAERRGELVRQRCFDPPDGLFYDFNHRTRQRPAYAFATTFLPLRVGLATPAPAARVAQRGLERLAIAGGLASSDREEYDQVRWRFSSLLRRFSGICRTRFARICLRPHSVLQWAPLQLFAVEGLRRYGFADEADRLSINFASCVLKVYLKTGEVRSDHFERAEHAAVGEVRCPRAIRACRAAVRLPFERARLRMDQVRSAGDLYTSDGLSVRISVDDRLIRCARFAVQVDR